MRTLVGLLSEVGGWVIILIIINNNYNNCCIMYVTCIMCYVLYTYVL